MLILIRGLPGSGKSTLAKKLVDHAPNWKHMETDAYFTGENNKYVFNKEALPAAHHWCQHCTQAYLQQGYNVVVSNTFSQIWEMQPYIGMAEKLGINFQVVECQNNFGSEHSIPEYVRERMKVRWETYP